MEKPSPLSPPDSPPLPHRFREKIAQHAFLNILGQAIPLLLGLVTIPIVAARLGVARFGVLGLAWAGLALAGAFDLGLGRATVKFVAESIERNDIARLRQTVSWSIALQALLGVGAGAILASRTPLLVSILQVPSRLLGEATATFYLLAISLPFTMLSFALRSVLEGAERFDIANVIRVPSGSALFLLPAVGALFGLGLPGIMVLLLGARILTCAATEWAVRRVVPTFRWQRPRDTRLLRQLATYGGWVAVSSALNPILLYFDRFLLGALAGTAAVAHYTAPFEVVVRLLLVPGALATALFPAFAVLSTRGDRTHDQRLLGRGARYLILALTVPTAVLIGLADELLSSWMGTDFARQAGLALQVLACGVFVNALAHLPSAYLQAVGRPDVTAKFHLIETPLYVVAAFVLVGRFGVVGAALAWTLRVTLDAVLLFGGLWWLRGLSPRKLLVGVGWRTLSASIAFGLAVAILTNVMESQLLEVIAVGTVTVGFAMVAWHGILDARERGFVASLTKGSHSSRIKVNP